MIQNISITRWKQLPSREAALTLAVTFLVGRVVFNQSRHAPHKLMIRVDHTASIVYSIRQDRDRIVGARAKNPTVSDRPLEDRLLLGILEAVQPCVKRSEVSVEAFAYEMDPVHQPIVYEQQPQDADEVTAAIKPRREYESAERDR